MTQSALGGALSVTDTGGAGTDQLVSTSAAAGGETIGVTGSQVTRSGGVQTISYSGIETLNVSGTAGVDTFNVTGSPSGTTTLDGLASGDTYNVTQSALGGALTVSDTGGGVGDQLFSTTAAAGGESIGVSDTQITRSGGEPTITYSGIEALNVSGTAGVDTLTDTTSVIVGGDRSASLVLP